MSTGEGDFFVRAWHLLTQIDTWSLATMAVGLGAVATLLAPGTPGPQGAGLPGRAHRRHRPVGPAGLEGHGVEIVGHIPSAVPTPAIPDVSGHEVAGLLGGGFGLALIVFAESFQHLQPLRPPARPEGRCSPRSWCW